ncbi:type I restriction-modification system endonuclease [Paenibacillus chondroitinus]|uniref:Type I restriction-modification system endonuclease n=1 Tax=Paenibacillus chondroitinus TaxID=59842 RepID=A0ABU6D8H1_9BACL|nr:MULTISPECIES: type I restriction-modification system endonuclease [Paenibacillus]MCY9658165.1 type I restriction-modification system endonuclease [Paenibacillus anseongense]MEB4793172.1 type I restriction-modification system endonuclease [Paenibacillus chondroitinus]
MKSNFKFLEHAFPILTQIGGTAEEYLYSDKNSCLIKLGLLGETIVNIMIQLDGIQPPSYDNTHSNRIKLLKNQGLLPREIDDILYSLRMARNKAVHANYDSLEDCKVLMGMAHELSIWFMQTYGDWQYTPERFELPIQKNQSQTDYEAIIREKEAKIEELTKLAELATVSPSVTIEERTSRGNKAIEQLHLSEAQTRYIIDEQLRKVGWEADTVNIRYSQGSKPQKGRNIAIAEWPTRSVNGKNGSADYALFVGLQMVGIIEAKRQYTDIPSVIDNQCKEYAQAVREDHSAYQFGQWGQYKVPFVFATNGRKYLKQLETKSGIWFLDLRKKSNISKALQGWMSPDGIMELLNKDTDAADRALGTTPYDLLSDADGLNLREYQIEAIEAAEKAIINGQDKVLLSMATGTGKTRTILGMLYRFLQSGRFQRILFLVDRTSLGVQAQDVFKEVKIEELMTLDNIYNIKELSDKEIDKETKLHVATVQSLVKRILYNEGDTVPAVSDYDLIIVDEAHRGYILDKEMSDDELLYRNQEDYMSKYSAVIDYFNAVKIGLTATPAVQTTKIFGQPVFNYSYRRAVVEGHLVDHDAPHTIVTKLSKEGINYKKGEVVAIYDPVTGEITNSSELEDELKFDVEKFNRKVKNENFNRTVLAEIAQDINPEGDAKTLIYAVDDSHADEIVNLLKKIYEPYDVDNDAVMKITGSIGGGNPKKVQEAIKRFKNERFPNIVVTVDLLTTGIDVPRISTLVFMRRVKSRILFEQMLGRATRLCPEIGKTHFEIYDPVGVYESLGDVNTMKYVVNQPSTSFDDLVDGLEVLSTEKQLQNQIDLIVAKMQRKKRNITKDALAHFRDIAQGDTPDQFIEKVKHMPVEQAKAYVLAHQKVFDILNEGGSVKPRAVVISDKDDKLVTHDRGYGKGLKPKDYLDEFKAFVTNNMNKIAALQVVCTRPSDLTRESLKSLRLELDREGFTEQQLNTAWKQLSNEEITADIISFIRKEALGSSLVSREERNKHAIAKLKEKHSFSKMELDWLQRIESILQHEPILDRDVFNSGAFKNQGGYNRINKIFRNQLDTIITDLNQFLFEDRGQTA